MTELFIPFIPLLLAWIGGVLSGYLAARADMKGSKPAAQIFFVSDGCIMSLDESDLWARVDNTNKLEGWE